jgi:hypothetical protein
MNTSLINKAVKASRKFSSSTQVKCTYQNHSGLENRKTDSIVRETSFMEGFNYALGLLKKE